MKNLETIDGCYSPKEMINEIFINASLMAELGADTEINNIYLKRMRNLCILYEMYNEKLKEKQGLKRKKNISNMKEIDEQYIIEKSKDKIILSKSICAPIKGKKNNECYIQYIVVEIDEYGFKIIKHEYLDEILRRWYPVKGKSEWTEKDIIATFGKKTKEN